jgi:hypothetical protein
MGEVLFFSLTSLSTVDLDPSFFVLLFVFVLAFSLLNVGDRETSEERGLNRVGRK